MVFQIIFEESFGDEDFEDEVLGNLVDVCLIDGSDSFSKGKLTQNDVSGMDTTDTSSKQGKSSENLDETVESSLNVSQDKPAAITNSSHPATSSQTNISSPHSPKPSQKASTLTPTDLDLSQIFPTSFTGLYQFSPDQTSQIKHTCLNNFINTMKTEENMFSYKINQEETEKQANKPLILNHSLRRYIGTLKFFDENKGFGFVTIDGETSKDLFIHHDDQLKANIDLKRIKTGLSEGVVKMSFCCLDYMGKYNRSRKAVELKLVEAY